MSIQKNQKDLYYIKKIEEDIKLIKINNKNLDEIKNILENKKKQLKGFNLYFAFLGLATFHLATIYSKKTVLHMFGKKAFPHIGLCLGIGVISGYMLGSIFGKNMYLYNYCKKLENNVKNI